MGQSMVWIYVNSNSKKEAEKIGNALLKQRLIACFALWPKVYSKYYWPPKSQKFERSKGPLIVLETLAKNYDKIEREIKKLHSDQVPFIGMVEIKKVNKDFYNWLKSEVEI